MIPRDFITEWRAHAPWIADVQVEQDLIICRALVELFSRPLIARSAGLAPGDATPAGGCPPDGASIFARSTMRTEPLAIAPRLPSPGWRAASLLTIGFTCGLMVLGALTRASMAGLSCPDWPLCHGHVVPPLDPGAYPPDPSYVAHKVYLEFLHRVIAGLTSIGAVLVGAIAWRRGKRARAAALWIVLVLQIAVGAATVWLENAPYTVVIHLALALAFLALALAIHESVFASPDGPPARTLRLWYGSLVGVVTVQMLVGANVSSSYFGLVCPDLPLCAGGALLPEGWGAAHAWHMGHRPLGVALLAAAAWLPFAARRAGAVPRDRRTAAAFAALAFAEVVLGGANVALGVPPWASAAHLGLSIVLFSVLLVRLAATDASPEARRPPVGTPEAASEVRVGAL